MAQHVSAVVPIPLLENQCTRIKMGKEKLRLESHSKDTSLEANCECYEILLLMFFLNRLVQERFRM